MLQPGTGAEVPPRRIARIEALPPELLFYLSRYMDLAGLIVFSTATSRALRQTFARFDRELLFLEPAHRLNLAEWREAARQVERVGLTKLRKVEQGYSGSVTERTGKEDLTETVHQLTKDESLIDLDLLQSVLAFLARPFLTAESPLAHQSRTTTSHASSSHGPSNTSVNKIRSLHLTGWHGIPGAFLINELRSRSCLDNVCTVVKTDRADSRIWSQAAADDRRFESRLCSTAPLDFQEWLRQTGSVGNLRPVMRFIGCAATQIIVQVGKRRPRRPEEGYLRGEGLQIGFQGFCLGKAERDAVGLHAETSDQEAVRNVGAQEELVSESDAEGSINSTAEGPDGERQVREADAQKLHVILQGREVEDGIENEEMFERSLVHCNHCKERIVF